MLGCYVFPMVVFMEQPPSGCSRDKPKIFIIGPFTKVSLLLVCRISLHILKLEYLSYFYCIWFFMCYRYKSLISCVTSDYFLPFHIMVVTFLMESWEALKLSIFAHSLGLFWFGFFLDCDLHVTSKIAIAKSKNVKMYPHVPVQEFYGLTFIFTSLTMTWS